jgi:predicted nucleic acid-binding protein
VRRLLDTNAVLYLLGGRLAAPLPPGEYLISVITEMELLSYPSLDSRSEKQITDFLTEVAVIGLTRDVEERAIQLRQQEHLKLPDAIVAATALVFDAELLTNDKKLHRVQGLKLRELAVRENPLGSS